MSDVETHGVAHTTVVPVAPAFLPFHPPPRRKVTALPPKAHKPRHKRAWRRRRGALVARNRFTVRLSYAESLALQARARAEGCTPSDLVRDALYEQYRIGELDGPTSDGAAVGRTH